MSYSGTRRTDPVQAFNDMHIVYSTGCWLWQGALNDRGYGQMVAGGKRVYAHRWSYEHFVGPIPEGLQINHDCRITRCVNPAHLTPMTARDNVRYAFPQDTCPHGHPWSENTYIRPDGKGRQCRECRRIRRRKKALTRANNATMVALQHK